MANKKGKAYKLTPEIQDAICKVLATAGTRTAALEYARISRDTFYRWLNEKPEFKEAVLAAEAKTRVYMENQLLKLIEGGDRLSLLFFLQNRYPDDWKNVNRYQVEQKIDINDQRVASMSLDQQLDELEKRGVAIDGLREIAERPVNQSPASASTD